MTAPYLLATKLEAFRGRGQGDLFASKDLEDVVVVVMVDRPWLRRWLKSRLISLPSFVRKSDILLLIPVLRMRWQAASFRTR